MEKNSINNNTFNELYARATNIIMYNEMQLKLLNQDAALRHVVKSLEELADIIVSLTELNASLNEIYPITEKFADYSSYFSENEIAQSLDKLKNNSIYNEIKQKKTL